MVFARRIEFFGSSVITRQQQAPVQHAFDKRRAVITLFHQPNEKELKATSILKLALTEVSAKVRKGEVEDDPEDYALRVWPESCRCG